MPKRVAPDCYNLLEENIFGVEGDDGTPSTVTLPGLLARLSQGGPTALTAVQAFQQHAVHAFLVQLAGIALVREGDSEPPHAEDGWRDLLLRAAEADGAGPEAFTLVVGDLAKPAFLQPPLPEGKLDVLKSEHTRPSAELDVLVTAKNHDVKVNRLDSPSVEHWVFALITIQTMQGFLGAGNYGIARMNGGFASRPCVGFAREHSASDRFRRDLEALLGARDSLIERFGFGAKGQLGLVWCASWDGMKSLSFANLDPFFIEICRRIRLSMDGDGVVLAHRGSSKAPRIEAGDLAGNTGDGWTPIQRDGSGGGKALTMPEAGFSYDRVQELLFEESYMPGAAGAHRPGDQLWVGQVLVRGQGKTGGYHERWLPVPANVRRLFARPDARSALAQRSKGWVSLARDARVSMLRPALLTLLQGGPEKLNFDDHRPEPYVRRFDAAVDGVFFRLLFEHSEEPPEIADEAFEKKLVELAIDQLDAARDSLPVPLARRWRADAHASRVLFGAAHRLFPAAYPPTNVVQADEAQQGEPT